MITSVTKHEELVDMHQEHEALREKLGQIHDLFNGAVPAPKEIMPLLYEFEEALVIHFANEEMDGFLAAVAGQAPSLAEEANRLWVEHDCYFIRPKRFASLLPQEAPRCRGGASWPRGAMRSARN